MTMKILLVTNRNPFFFELTACIEKTIGDMGHECVFFDIRNYLFHPRLRQKFPWVQQLDESRINRDLQRKAEKSQPDFCLVMGGVTVHAESIKKIKNLHIPIFLWTTDAPHPQHFSKVIETAPLYDRVFCAGTEAVEILSQHGFQRATWLPFACVPEYHHAVQLSNSEKNDFAHDLVFVGSYYPNRARLFEPLADYDIKIWGPLWNRLSDYSPIKKKCVDAQLNVDVWTKIYSVAKIVLIAHYQDGKILCYQASPKVFEAMACGSFCLIDDQKDVRVLFREGDHCALYNGPDELRSKVDYYLAHADERRRMAAAAREFVLQNHQYKNRMQTILEALSRS